MHRIMGLCYGQPHDLEAVPWTTSIVESGVDGNRHIGFGEDAMCEA